jgi:hypothetical protein
VTPLEERAQERRHRDQLAATILSGLIARDLDAHKGMTIETYAQTMAKGYRTGIVDAAYQVADAMLDRRDQKPR